MGSVTIRNFGGMLPRYGEQHLPETAAVTAINCRLDAGELQTYRKPTWIETWAARFGTIYRAYYAHIPEIDADAPTLIPFFDDPTVDFIKAPITQDSHNRFYWTQASNYPLYNTSLRISQLYGPLRLGVEPPINAPSLSSVTGGTAALKVYRAYVFTFVTDYGEESAPSAPSPVLGYPDDATWNIQNIPTSAPGAFTTNLISKVRIYRTITGTTGTADYFRVHEMTLGTGSTWADTLRADVAALKPLLESKNWNTPPTGLLGLLSHPSGFLVAFKGRDVYFSVPFRPHAWPVDYILSVRFDIVGIELSGATIVVLTKSSPFLIQGARPDGMTITELKSPDACISRRAIVGGSWGVMYPSTDGLMLIANGSYDVQNVTEKFLTRREWQTRYMSTSMQAAEHSGSYVAFYETQKGFVINMSEPQQVFIELESTDWEHEAFQKDPLTGAILMTRQSSVYEWNPVSGDSVQYTWKSKVFDTPKPLNFGAYRIDSASTLSYLEDVDWYERAVFNSERLAAAPLNPVNFAAVNSSRTVTLPTSTLSQNGQSISGPMYRGLPGSIPDAGEDTAFVHLRVWAEEELVYDEDVPNTLPLRLPTGFRRSLWQFELTGNADIRSFKMAETGKELSEI